MIDLTTRGDCAVIILNRPRVLNALSFDGLGRLEAALDQVARSEHRALVVTGAGDRAFCAGADVEELRGRTPMECRRDSRRGQAVFQRLENLPLPSVAAINGWALGGGLELAMACTFRVAHRRARAGLPGVRPAPLPRYGGTPRPPPPPR